MRSDWHWKSAPQLKQPVPVRVFEETVLRRRAGECSRGGGGGESSYTGVGSGQVGFNSAPTAIRGCFGLGLTTIVFGEAMNISLPLSIA